MFSYFGKSYNVFNFWCYDNGYDIDIKNETPTFSIDNFEDLKKSPSSNQIYLYEIDEKF